MKKLLIMLFLSVLIFSCEKDELESIPIEITSICHKLNNGDFQLINIYTDKENGHILQGDGYPGECYDPKQKLFLSNNCEIVSEGCSECGISSLCDTILKVDFENATHRYLCTEEWFWISDTPIYRIDARVYFLNISGNPYYLYRSQYSHSESFHFSAFAHISYYLNDHIQYEEIISTEPGFANKRNYDAVVQLSDYIAARMEAAGFVDDCPK